MRAGLEEEMSELVAQTNSAIDDNSKKNSISAILLKTGNQESY